MAISETVLAQLLEEQNILAKTLSTIEKLIDQNQHKLIIESERAKELTQAIMNTQREEDKALLASDEAVSHGMRDQKKQTQTILAAQRERPYFARIELAEEDEKTGNIKPIEYKLGFFANPDCRIVDWRKAPISKLYYEYKEGEEYSEEILGRERFGTIKRRVRVEIEKGTLRAVTGTDGAFHWDEKTATWIGGTDKKKIKSAAGQLPEILSLISAEQFRAITEEASTAVLIQGVAGSGKTTVALHRLAWMLHEDNSSLTASGTTFIVLSPSLRAYIENSLPSADVKDVSVRTFHEWAARTLHHAAMNAEFRLARPIDRVPSGIDRVKRSMALLKAIEQFVAKQEDRSFRTTIAHLQGDILSVLKTPSLILENDETRLIDAALIKDTYERTKRNFSESLYDWSDDALLLRLFQLKVGHVITEDKSLGRYEHIFVDEVQDFSPVELATIIGAVKKVSDVTLVGDTSQNIDQNQSFPGWEKLQKHWNLNQDISRYITLAVSYRSTLPIMKLADYIQDRETVTTGREGRRPIWFKCLDEEHALESAINWLKKAIEFFPNSLTAVICATPAEAKFLVKMLTPTFGPMVRLGDASSFSFEEGILVTDVRQVKGLEFYSVLLWNPSKANYPKDALGRNLLYVAVTRAEENLSLVTYDKPADILPKFNGSKLIRSMDLTIVEEEEKEEPLDRD